MRRRRGSDRGPRLVRGLGFLVVGAALLATLWPFFARDMGWSGRSGTLTVSSCTPGAGSHPVDTCEGALRLSGDSTVRSGAWVTSQDYHLPGSVMAVRAGSDGSLQTTTGADRLGTGTGVLLCCVALAVGLVELARPATWRRGRRPWPGEAVRPPGRAR